MMVMATDYPLHFQVITVSSRINVHAFYLKMHLIFENECMHLYSDTFFLIVKFVKIVVI